MKRSSRFCALLIALCCMLPAVGCAGESTAPAETTAAPVVTSQQPESTEPPETEITDTVPRDLKFTGETVSFLLRNGVKAEFVATDVTGEVVNDAVLARNRAVEERFGITLDYIASTASWSDYNAEIRRSVQGQTGEYDVVTNYAYYGAALAVEGLYLDLHDLPHLSLTQPWWNQSFVDEMTLQGSLFFTVGDLTTTTFDRAMVTFFNKQMVENNFGNLDLYAVVKDGKWTLDYLGELVKDTYQDLDGDTVNELDDFHGVSFNLGSMCVDGFQSALGIDVTTRNADGVPAMSINTPRFIDAYEKLYNFIYRNSGVGYNPTTKAGYYGTMGNDYYASQKLFNRQCIFAFDILRDTGILRDFSDPYGILPLPKFDENQTQYRTTPQDSYSIVSVPTTVTSPEMIGAVLEVMCFESNRQIRPAYFEKAYKYKYLDAPADAEMFDLVVDTISYNFGVLNSNALGDPAWIFRNQMVAGTESITKLIAATEKIHAKKLTSVIEKYGELNT